MFDLSVTPVKSVIENIFSFNEAGSFDRVTMETVSLILDPLLLYKNALRMCSFDAKLLLNVPKRREGLGAARKGRMLPKRHD